jgi:hypothetical protein
VGTILPEWTYLIWFSFAAVAFVVFANYIREYASPNGLRSPRMQIAVGLTLLSGASMLRSGTIWTFLMERRSLVVEWPWLRDVVQVTVTIATVVTILAFFLIIRAMSYEKCGERGWLLAGAIGFALAGLASLLT